MVIPVCMVWNDMGWIETATKTGDNEPWRRYDASVRPMKVIEIAERARRHVITSATSLAPSSTSTVTAATSSMTVPSKSSVITSNEVEVKRAVDRVLSSYRDLVLTTL
jgi:hypothetical protein